MKRFLLLLVAVAIGLGVAAFNVSSNAATVNGAAISQSALNADLSAIAGSSTYQCYLGLEHALTSRAGSPAILPVNGVGDSASGTHSTYNTAFVRFWLDQMIDNEFVAQVAARHGLTVTTSDVTVGRDTLTLQIQGALTAYQQQTGSSACAASASAVLSSLPPSFVTNLASAQAEQDVLLAWAAGYSLDAGALERFYVHHRSEFDTVCLSVIQETSQAAGQQALAKVRAGTPFTQVGTAAPAGCAVLAGARLPTSLSDLRAGQVGPLVAESSGSYALVEMTKRTPTAFAKARTDVRDAVLVAGEQHTSALLAAASRRVTVTADPRYGRAIAHSLVLVLPKVPPGSAMLAPAANIPSQPSTTQQGSSTTNPAG